MKNPPEKPAESPSAPEQAPPPGRRLRRTVVILNTMGFLLFLCWLFSLRDTAILREQDGILYFLPCLPFLFVFLLMLPRPPPKPSDPPPSSGDDSEKQ